MTSKCPIAGYSFGEDSRLRHPYLLKSSQTGGSNRVER